MPSKDSFSVWVEVDGVRLREYGEVVRVGENGCEISCWIPSEAGKQFTICVLDEDRIFHSGCYTSIDGIPLPRSKLIFARRRLVDTPPNTPSLRIKGFDVSPTSTKPFIFSTCELVEDEDAGERSLSQLGQINLVIREMEVISSGCAPLSTSQQATNLPALRISERAKKAMVHGIQLGDEVQTGKRDSHITKRIRHVVEFVFKYRPLDVLKADGVIPATAPREGYVPNDEIIDLTADDEEEEEDPRDKEIRLLREQLSALEQSRLQDMQGRKRKRDKADIGIKREIKTEF
ncbi:hypothetical protein BJ165DRAFT_1507585 [Panaeolus papilionaceus]|nr:hypothetical protein BJ165DRAFT_1507585 [Panaeolus papilionaceus]